MRFDLIISYWIFFWYILYILKIIKYNPKIALIIVTIGNIIMVFLMLIYNTKKNIVFLYFIMLIILKIIPLYSIWNDKIRAKDIYFTIFIFILYLLWLSINKKETNKIINNYKNLLFYSMNSMPGMQFLSKFIF